MACALLFSLCDTKRDIFQNISKKTLDIAPFRGYNEVTKRVDASKRSNIFLIRCASFSVTKKQMRRDLEQVGILVG